MEKDINFLLVLNSTAGTYDASSNMYNYFQGTKALKLLIHFSKSKQIIQSFS